MFDKNPATNPSPPVSLRLAMANREQEESKKQEDTEEESCPAFGYLRGMHERAQMVEFRFRNGNSLWCPYAWLGPWHYNPSVGVLLKFTGDVVTLVLICGSNLNAKVNGGAMNLTDRGFQRHRVTFVREMDEGELRKTGDMGPTIDRIEVTEFESIDGQREWLKKVAPVFLRP
jgi:hypothetical protein